MNKGLYKKNHDNFITWVNYWKNSSENFGQTVSLKKSAWTYSIYNWKNTTDLRGKELIGSACLVQW